MTSSASAAAHTVTDGRVPILDRLFAQICRATPQEARDFAMPLTMSERATLALSCNGRAHLREQGRAIAGACTLASLVKEGGHAGLVLFQQVEAGAETWGTTAPKGQRRVSLAG